VTEIVKRTLFPSKVIKKQSIESVDDSIIFTLNSAHIMELVAIKDEYSRINQITQDVIFKNNNTELLIKNLSQVGSKLSSTVFYLLTALIMQFNSSTRDKKQVLLSVTNYQELRGVTSKKKLLEQIRDDLNLLSSFYISYKFIKRNSKKCNSFYNVRLIQGWGCTNDNITISFSDEFYEHLKNNTYPMPFHKEIFKLNPKTSAQTLGFYLFYLYNMNHDKKNANVVSVRSMLEHCPTIPSKDKAYPKLNQKIVEPFERALEALQGILRWHYTNAKKEPLTQEQLNTFNYNIFINSSVYYDFITDVPTYQKKKKKITVKNSPPK